MSVRVVLETPRLVLREMTQDDFDALRAMLEDERVMYAYEGAFDDAGVQAWLDKQRDRYRTDGFGLWALVLKEDGQVAGQCGLTYQDFEGAQVVEVGYLLNHAHWHRGLATEAARACRDYAFDVLGESEVYSIVRDTNTASQQVALRNGMSPCGRFVKRYRNVDMPHIAFSVTREKRDELRSSASDSMEAASSQRPSRVY